MNIWLCAFMVGLFHLQSLPWYMGILAYGASAICLIEILVDEIRRKP